MFSVHQRNLHEATRQGDLDTVRQLIDEGMDVNVRGENGVSQSQESVQLLHGFCICHLDNMKAILGASVL